MSLQSANAGCNKFLWLQCDEQAARARLASSNKASQLGFSPAEVDEQYKHFHRHIKTFADRYQAVQGIVDSNRSPEAVWGDVQVFLERAPVSKAPRRPMRVLLLGPTGAGKATQSKQISQRHGLIHISTGKLLRREAAQSEAFAAQVEEFMEAGALVPDTLVSPLVVQRLLQRDCRERGWILDGFPRTTEQADALTKNSLQANRCIVLNVDEKECLERITQRRIDPATGEIYYLKEATPSKSMIGRLVTQSKDKDMTARTLIMEYQQSSEEMCSRYANILKKLDGTQDVNSITEQIECFLFTALGSGRRITSN
jgi:adenylate kinase